MSNSKNQISRSSLGIERLRKDGHIVLGWSIAIPDKYLCNVTIHNKKDKIPYQYLPPDKQYEFMIKYIEEVVTPNVVAGRVSFELNKSGQLHSHIICVIGGSQTTKHYDITCLRKGLLYNSFVKRITKGRNAHRLNYIHDLTDINSWIEYLDKDIGKTPYPYYDIKNIHTYIDLL